MSSMKYLPCLFTFLSVYCSEILSIIETDEYQNITNFLPVPKNETNQTESNNNRRTMFGILNTLKDYAVWAEKEEEIVEVLTKRFELINTEINLIDNYLEDYEESTGEAMKNLKENKSTPEERGKIVGSSAILGHRMTSRYAGVVSDLRKLLSSEEYQDNQKNVTEILELNWEKANSSNSSNWVGLTELFMSLESFIHIQEIQGYKMEEIIDALKFENIPAQVEMSPLHSMGAFALQIGVFALYRQYYYLSVEWLQYAVNQTLLELNAIITTDDSAPNDLALALVMISIQEHNRVFNKNETEFDIFINMYSNPIPQKRISRRKALFYQNRGVGNASHAEAQFMDLCRGNISQTPSMQKSLKCFYENRRHPYLYINPIKVEHLSETPPVFQFYEMIGENTTDELIEFMSQNATLKPSLTFGDNSVEKLVRWRTSVGIGILEETPLEKIFMLADMVTGINIWDKEDRIQYVEYTYGRFYDQHSDVIDENLEEIKEDDRITEEIDEKGDRVATLLYYLAEPEHGGYTPFCEAGVFARPIKRSATFWYNLYRNGTARNDVHHGACPVLQGHKIIMNHWVRHFTNWQAYKCSLNQYE